MVMLTRKDSTSQEVIKLRICIPARDEKPIPGLAVFLPPDSD
jgi:hypothetical protein